MKTSKLRPIDGLVFRTTDGQLWQTFAPGIRVWRWAGWLWRRLWRVPSRVQRLELPEGVRTVRAEPFRGTLPRRRGQASRLARQAPLRGSREA